MTADRFNQIVKATCESIDRVLASKAIEYAISTDRLHNFKRAAMIGRCSPTRALLGMMNKHLVSVLDIIDDIDNGKLPSAAMVEEKIGDLINYLVLLKGLIYELIEKEPVINLKQLARSRRK